MITTEFERWINQGLGRAVTRLRAEEDKSPFYDTVRHILLRENTSGDYAYDLINCYDNTAELIQAAITSVFTSRAEGWQISFGIIDLLAKFYRDGNAAAGDKLEEFYTKIFADASARTSRIESDNSSLFSYIHIAFTLAEIKDEKRLHGILADMGTLYDKKELFSDPANSFNNFYSHARNNFLTAFEAALTAIRTERSGIFPLGDYFDELAVTLFRKPAPGECASSKAPTVTFEMLYELMNSADPIIEPQYFELLETLTEEQKIKLAIVIKDETDPKRLSKIIWIFTSTLNFWPLDPAILINTLRKYEWYLHEKDYKIPEKRLTDGLIIILYNLRSDAVRDYALELVERGYLDEGAALWAKSLHPEDWEQFTLLLKKLDSCGFHTAHALISMLQQENLNEIEADISNDDISKAEKSADLLKYLYENSYDRVIRHYTVLELRRRNLLTDEMIEECRFDDFPPTRRLFNKQEA
jgi:hypothetical protein